MTQTNSVAQRLNRLPNSSRRGSRKLRYTIVALALLGLLWWGYTKTSKQITLVVNGKPHPISTHHFLVATILQEMNLPLEPEDVVQPEPETILNPGDTVTIKLARPVVVEADGRIWQILTHRQNSDKILLDIGLTLNPRDELFINGEKVAPPSPLPNLLAQQQVGANKPYQQLLAQTTPRGATIAGRPQTARLVIHRSVPVTLHEGQARSTFYTARPTVGEALLEQGITLFLGDNVTPGLGTQLSPGRQIYIERATPISINVDGLTIKTRVHQKTVGGVLAQEGIALMGEDFSRPAMDHEISAYETIEIVRVSQAIEVKEEFIPFETEWIADKDIELDRQEVRQKGATGIIKMRTRVRYENSKEVRREIEDEWLDQEPGNRIVAYGTNIVLRTLNTENGPIEYWRKISMRATAYSAATSGKSNDHPLYGVTRSGLQAGYGVVAVDSKVIPLMTNLHIEDYGPAVAGDTGGRILGKHIDLGYPGDQPLPVIFEWRDVYLLTPVPNADKIRYVLPNWPQQ